MICIRRQLPSYILTMTHKTIRQLPYTVTCTDSKTPLSTGVRISRRCKYLENPQSSPRCSRLREISPRISIIRWRGRARLRSPRAVMVWRRYATRLVVAPQPPINTYSEHPPPTISPSPESRAPHHQLCSRARASSSTDEERPPSAPTPTALVSRPRLAGPNGADLTGVLSTRLERTVCVSVDIHHCTPGRIFSRCRVQWVASPAILGAGEKTARCMPM